ncbi:MAG: hypothetical protein WBQ83_04695, partial [Candidatus Acidiferrales bacterium]
TAMRLMCDVDEIEASLIVEPETNMPQAAAQPRTSTPRTSDRHRRLAQTFLLERTTEAYELMLSGKAGFRAVITTGL